MPTTTLNPAQQQYYQDFLPKWLLGTAGLGLAVGGGTGLMHLLHHNLKQEPKPPQPMMINVPYRAPTAEEEKEKEQGQPVMARKAAGVENSWFFGSGASTPGNIPAAYPITLLGGAGAYLGGKGIMDAILKTQKDKAQESEIESAREEYEKAMMGQFKPVHHSKIIPGELKNGPKIMKLGEIVYPDIQSRLDPETVQAIIEKKASENEVVTRIADKLDALTKSAEGFWEGALAKPVGWYAAAAPILGIGAGMATYHLASKDDKARAEAELMKKQMAERARQLPNLFARLVPVDEAGTPLTPRKERPRLEEVMQNTSTYGRNMPSTKLATTNEIDAKAAAFVRDVLGVK